MGTIKKQKLIDLNSIFEGRYLNSKALYLYHFHELPSLHNRYQIDGEKAYEAFREQFASRIMDIHQYRWFDQKRKKFHFDTTIIILNNHCLMEINQNYCQLLHNNQQGTFLEEVDHILSRFREKQKREPREMNLIVRTNEGLELKPMEIKRTKLDLDLFYPDDFTETTN